MKAENQKAWLFVLPVLVLVAFNALIPLMTVVNYSVRMAPEAVFSLLFFQLYSSISLFDTHIAVALAHALFNVPLSVWRLEGFMNDVPKELDETAYVDGYSFPLFFVLCFRG